MSRRADPERIYQARRAAIFHGLIGDGRLDELDAEHWISRWEREAETLGLERLTREFWEEGGRWIEAHRARQR